MLPQIQDISENTLKTSLEFEKAVETLACSLHFPSSFSFSQTSSISQYNFIDTWKTFPTC